MEKINVGNLHSISEQMARVVHIQDKEIAIFKLSSGEIKAIENKCPHKGGKLSEGILCEHFVYCPLHDWKIDLHDGVVQDPDVGCVQYFETEVDSVTGEIYIISSKMSLA